MNEPVLIQKLNLLSRYDVLKKEDINRFGEIIKSLGDWELFRINPLTFAQKYEFELNSVVDIFLHSVKIGLFDFSWNLICPMCGGVEHSHGNLNNLSNKDSFYCVMCNYDVSMDLDQQVEVSFNLSSSIRDLEIEPYSSFNNYRKYFFSPNYQIDPNMLEMFKGLSLGIEVIEPDETGKIPIEAVSGKTYRVVSLQTHSQFKVHVTDKSSDLPQIVEVDLLGNGFYSETITVDNGKLTIYIHNRSKSKLIVDYHIFDLSKVISEAEMYPKKKYPFMTGKMLLNNQKFRELFRIQALAPDLKLNVKSLTIMFTNLKGSTEMYEKIGDINAYNLVQKHFDILIESVKKYSGAIVKTMGDAIMATFSSPSDGVMAAVDMMNSVSTNKHWDSQGHEIGLKIGLNEGNALVVNADERLDYFGQSVNVAARVQGLAQAGEIWLTDSIFGNDEVKDIISGFEIEKQSAILKGVGKPVIVYKCAR